MLNSLSRDYVFYRLNDRRQGETHMHISRECSRAFNICFGLPKNHVLTAPVGRVIVRLRESGIIKKFFSDEMDSVAKVAEER